MTRCRSGTADRDHTLSADQAREAAQRFVQDSVSGFSADRQLDDLKAVSGPEGALWPPRRRAVDAGKAVAGDTWPAGRWTVMIDRGLSGRTEALFRDTERLGIDARTRAVPGQRGAYEIDADRGLPVAEGAPRTVTRYGYGGEVTLATPDYGSEVAPATTDVEETPSGAAPGGTPPVGIRTPTVFRTTHEACVPDQDIDIPDDGIGRESGAGSEYRFHGAGLGMVYETGNGTRARNTTTSRTPARSHRRAPVRPHTTSRSAAVPVYGCRRPQMERSSPSGRCGTTGAAPAR